MGERADCRNTVKKLKKLVFKELPLAEQLEVKCMGRPMPALEVTTTGCSRDKMYKRSFNMDNYTQIDWLCGCEVTNRLYCYPCLLYHRGDGLAWANEGVGDFKHLTEKVKKHQATVVHINNALDLALLGSTSIESMVTSASRSWVERHNRQVTKNRDALAKFINCIKFCGNLELFSKHDAKEGCQKKDCLSGVIDFASTFDSEFKVGLENCSIFQKFDFNDIINDLLECMLKVCCEYITSEISDSFYVSVMVEETTYLSDVNQMAIAYRLEKNGRPVERFWGFCNPCGELDASTIAGALRAELRVHFHANPARLIAQTFSSAATTSAIVGEIQTLISHFFKYAYPVYSYVYPVKRLVEHTAAQNARAKSFYSNFNGILAFFSNTLQSSKLLDTLREEIPSLFVSQNSANIFPVIEVHEKKTLLTQYFESLTANPSSSETTVCTAENCVRTLNDPEFDFWLSFFKSLMCVVRGPHEQLLSKEVDFSKTKEVIHIFYQDIQNLRRCLDLELSVKSEPGVDEPPEKRTRVSRHDNELILAAQGVCDGIVKSAVDSFEFLNHLQGFELLDSSKLASYYMNFPAKQFNSVCNTYRVLDKEKFRTELCVLYKRLRFPPQTDTTALMKFFLDNDLKSSFSETMTLLNILVVTPVFPTGATETSSSIVRLRSFLRNNKCQENLRARAMISVERNMITEIPIFNVKVIERFSKLKGVQEELTLKT